MAIQVGSLLACDIEPTSGVTMVNRIGQGLGMTECRSTRVGLNLGLGGLRWDQG